MDRLFECLDTDFFKVPDGTWVNPFLNPTDSMSGLPWGVLDGLSIAAGYIPPGTSSEIHVHLFISHVTVLMSGSLAIHMKDPGNLEAPYTIELKAPAPTGGTGFTTAATLAVPGTFFQLDNTRGSEPAHVLYLTSPGYVFEPGKETDEKPIYDDAITVGRDWKQLEACNWNPTEISNPEQIKKARQNTIKRLAKRSLAAF